MGEACCRRDINGPETKLFRMEPYNLVDKPLPAIDMALLKQITEKYSSNIKSIIKIQACYRGRLARKIYPKQQISSLTIIKYISAYIASPEPAVCNIVKKLGPFIVSWDLESFQNTLILKPTILEEDGSQYKGYWNKDFNVKEGYGQQLFPNGTIYEGFWKNNEFDGQGRFIYENGDYYCGDWIQGKTNGQGTFVSTDGIAYVGGWKDNLHHGYGIFVYIDDKKGVETWEDGSHFEGNYEDGRKEGKGKFHWTDGSIYEGDFVNNKLCGYGVYTWADGRIYKGEWKDSKMEGKGEFLFPDGKIYVGEMKNDSRHGFGKMTWYFLIF